MKYRKFTQTNKLNKLMRLSLLKVEDYWKKFDKYKILKRKDNNVPSPYYSSFIGLSGDAIAFSSFMFADIVKHQGFYLINYPDAPKNEFDPEGEFIPN